jgi:hypothetical protein
MTDQANGLGMAAQPALAEMPFAVGEFPAGEARAQTSIYTLVKTKATHGSSSVMWQRAVGRILQMEIHVFGSHLLCELLCPSFFCSRH